MRKRRGSGGGRGGNNWDYLQRTGISFSEAISFFIAKNRNCGYRYIHECITLVCSVQNFRGRHDSPGCIITGIAYMFCFGG